MSFFVSKDLEGKIDENCLIPNESIKTEREFVFIFKDSYCNIVEANFENGLINIIKFKFDANIHVLDNLFEDYENKGKIIFKKSYFDLQDIQIEKIFKKESDNYILEASAVYHRGN